MAKKRNPDQAPFDFMLPETTWVEPDTLPDLRGAGVIAVDTETKDDGLANSMGPGWVYGMGHIAGISMASKKGSVYIPIRHPDSKNFPIEQVIKWANDHIHGGDEIIFQNAPYDIGWLHADMGIKPPAAEKLHDTIAMAYMLDEQRLTYNLDALCEWMDIEGKDEETLRLAAEAMGLDPKADMWRMPARYVGEYADQDAVSTLELYEKMLPMIQAQGVWDAYRLECELIPMVHAMRLRGVRIDTDKAEEVRDMLLAQRDEALGELSRRLNIGRAVTVNDVNSPIFMERVFTDEGIRFPRTKLGNASFQAEWMEKMDHWLPELCVRVSKMQDAGEKFVGNYIMGFTHKGRLHAEVHQFRDGSGGTKTSRLAYSNPPLQQMPSRNPTIADAIRGLFLPEQGEVWGALDYSQQEYRLIVHFAYLASCAGADQAVEVYNQNAHADFHRMAADMTRLPRRRAKDVNFAKAFGAGVPKFALMTGMDEEEAAAVMAQYDDKLPFVKRLGEETKKVANSRGHVRLLDGARARFDRWEPRWVDWDDPKIKSSTPMGACSMEEARRRVADPDHPWSGRLRRAFTHKSMNWLIQGSAARMTKLSMRACWQEGLLPLLQMHDELDFSFDNKGDALRAEELMRDTVKLQVPVVVDAEFGDTWGNAKVKKDEDGNVLYGATFEEAWELVHGK